MGDSPETQGRKGGLQAIVVGAGVGGLAAGVALSRFGINAVVLERLAEFRQIQVGGGLHMWPNAMKVHRQLGLEDRIREIGAQVERLYMRTWRGKVLVEAPVGEIGREVGAPAIGVRRTELQSVLAEALPDGVLQLGSELTHFDQDADGVTVTLADGRTERGDVLIGADGIRSVVREQLHHEGVEPRYSGYTSYIGSTVFAHPAAPPEILTITFGPAARFVCYSTGHGRMSFIANLNSPPGAADPPEGRKAALIEAYRGWGDPVEPLIAATDEEKIAHMDLADREPLPRWGDGRVTLLGDAAHAMVPDVAQGACMAIEDSLVLAKSLSSHADVRDALRAYEAERQPRTSAVQKQARFAGRMGQIENPFMAGVRDRIMKAMGPKMLQRERQFMGYEA